MLTIGASKTGVSNTAAAALWAIDYVLQATVHGVQKLYFHNGIGYKYDLVSLPYFLVNRHSTDMIFLPPPTVVHG